MRLIAIDLDGTLLSSDGKISAENKRALKKLVRKGYQIAVVTGRAVFDAQALMNENGLLASVIGSNGAVIQDSSGRIIHATSIPIRAVQKILTYLLTENMYFELTTRNGLLVPTNGETHLKRELDYFIDHKMIVGRRDKLWEKAKTQFRQYGQIRVSDPVGLLKKDLSIYKLLTFTYDSERLLNTMIAFSTSDQVELTSSGTYVLEFIPHHVNKGTGIEFLAARLGLANKQIIAIGDNHNDIPMFKVAGAKIAMGNAAPSVKKMSTFVTKRNDENGVAYALQHLLNI
ncbi:MAG: Cof-type HAD-IIB family hydrolase [Sporolactobacillus sp.]|jgi:Cof subfamily protein (haloacid dehalogenase superfamily)|nr:Cof-type HAD-IIB family hydrolase [Sporolactobacillus sp.]